ncbi:double-strand break repair protein AddB [Acuticoccus yangtzensis]|uniref:double-strand break repair protein AddB n=1 Tax=Acuticoccus yangtzensis TaxID=1443441 RepID=UPI0009499CDA|nr:double-strand break repair protein AddB [Acuticoccus yangtzensis]
MRVYAVDPADPFLPTLAARVADGFFWPDGRLPDDPLALSRVTIYLPTRRAARELATAFLDLAPGRAALLPRIEPLGDPDEEPEDRPDVMSRLEARVVLARLVGAWAEAIKTGDPTMRPLVSASGPDTVRLADDLLGLLDQVETQEASWDDLPGLVDRTDLAEHWKITTDFLTIATEMWPVHLASMGKMTEAAARRADAEAAERQLAHATGPIIVAGSTGSLPATRRLIGAIAASPWGAVVLPGFDRRATAADWDALAAAPDAPGHVQFGMKLLVDTLGLAPGDVERLTPRTPSATPEARTLALNAALRPAAATGSWINDRAGIDLRAALDAVTLVDAADEREEAAAVAIAMRRSVEAGERTALITPHRDLARRVTHHLLQWGIRVDDSGGLPIGLTPAGTLARLVAATAFGGGAAEWLALLKHDGARFPAEAGALAEVERMLRGPRVDPGRMIEAIAAAGEKAATLATSIRSLYAPLAALAGTRTTIGAFAAAQKAVMDKVAAPLVGYRQNVLATLAELSERHELTIPAADWASTFEALIGGVSVRARPMDDAVNIFGPLEARLQSFDHTVLAGLNEGSWPAPPDAGPWMSRGMMGAFGIEPPERRIGLSVHDFYQAAHHPRVTLSRAKMAAGEPMVASRWWQRLTAFAQDAAEPATKRGDELIGWARHLNRRTVRPTAQRPAPKPPVAVRPKSFRVTEITRLVRDPYAIYARHVLGLQPLEPLEQEAGAGDRGELFHDVLATFIENGHHRHADAEDRFRAVALEALKTLGLFPEAQALWGARLSYIAPFVAAEEAARVARADRALVEVSATAQIGGLTLRGRIDRIDLGVVGASIIDYKTGTPPSAKQVKSFLEPQLALEAALFKAGAVEGAPADLPLTDLTYVAIGSGRNPVAWKPVAGEDAAALAEEARERLAALHALYQNPEQGYLSRARPMREADVGDYDHLARVAEWQNE